MLTMITWYTYGAPCLPAAVVWRLLHCDAAALQGNQFFMPGLGMRLRSPTDGALLLLDAAAQVRASGGGRAGGRRCLTARPAPCMLQRCCAGLGSTPPYLAVSSPRSAPSGPHQHGELVPQRATPRPCHTAGPRNFPRHRWRRPMHPRRLCERPRPAGRCRVGAGRRVACSVRIRQSRMLRRWRVARGGWWLTCWGWRRPLRRPGRPGSRT